MDANSARAVIVTHDLRETMKDDLEPARGTA
jgi:hypothetical protein